MSVTTLSLETGSERAASEIRIFDSPDAPADPLALAGLRAGVASADLAAPAVVLPDFQSERPSS